MIYFIFQYRWLKSKLEFKTFWQYLTTFNTFVVINYCLLFDVWHLQMLHFTVSAMFSTQPHHNLYQSWPLTKLWLSCYKSVLHSYLINKDKP